MPVLNTVQLFYSEVSMNALFASLAWCLARPNRASILSAVLCATIWPFVNKPLEGHVLMVLSPGHGITTSDLLSVFTVIVVAAQVGRMHSKAKTQAIGRTAEPQQRTLPTQSAHRHLDLDHSPTHPTVPLRRPAGPSTYRSRPTSTHALRHTTRPPQHHSPRRVAHPRRLFDTPAG